MKITRQLRKILLLTVVCFLPFFSFSAFSQSHFIVAKVNHKIVTNSELDDRYRYVISSAKIKVNSEQERKLLLSQILDKMVDEELIKQEASNLKIEITNEEISEAVEELAMRQKKNSAQLKLYFVSNKISFENYLSQIESELMWSKMVSEILQPKVKVTEVEVREFFEQRKFNTDVRKLLISEVLIPQSDNAASLAEKLVLELNNGANFETIVRQFSSAVNAESGGEIGWVSQSDIDQKVYEAISKLTKGHYSNPVLLPDGYHIFKLLDAKTEKKVADRDMKMAQEIIFTRKLQSLAKGYLMDMRRKAFVETKLGKF